MPNKRKRSKKNLKKTKKNMFKKTNQQLIDKLMKLNMSSEYKKQDDDDIYKIFVFDLDNTL